jgi:aquaporin related protein
MERAPTMNIHKAPTTLSRVDPLKHIFKGIFDALPDGARATVVAIIGEFLGTLCFIFFAFAGVEVAAASSNRKQDDDVSTATPLKNPSLLLYASLSAGFSLLIFGWIFFRVSGGLFNPVVRLPMRNYTMR